MPSVYGRDLDLNLLRVFAVVAEAGSVTEAASRLYLTQPAVSAALRRLQVAIGAPLFVRAGRGLALTSRGERLRAAVHPHLAPLVEAALEPARFDPRTSERTLRVGLADAAESWLLPRLLRVFAAEAPRLRVIASTVQFRTVAAAFAGGLDLAVTVADELPGSVRRQRLFDGGFVGLFDPRHVTLAGARFTEAEYFAAEHVIVSYNGDLRGIVEDVLPRSRRVRCSVASFQGLGALVEGGPLVATVPALVAAQIRATRRRLVVSPLPFRLAGAATELLWPAATDDDEPCRFVRSKIVAIAREVSQAEPVTAPSSPRPSSTPRRAPAPPPRRTKKPPSPPDVRG